MSVEPSADSIETVMSIASCSYDNARRYLRVKQNDVAAALNAALDHEDLTSLENATTWDEGVFSADRDGNQTATLAPLTGPSNAPTRGPSPAPSLGLQNPKSKAEEDEEMEKALLASQGLGSFQQETGVRAKDGTESKYFGATKCFGPATKDHYEESRWALVPRAREVVPDVLPQERKHVEFEPRILKHLPDGDYTPNLLSICCAIPKAKAALLLPHWSNKDYGFEEDWWQGHPIATPRIVHTTDGTPADPGVDKSTEFIMEVHRLVAMLSSSERSYATIGALTQADLVKEADLSSESGGLLKHFLDTWTAAITKLHPRQEELDQITGVFNTVVGTTHPAGMRERSTTVFNVPVKSTDGEKTDLLELLDNLLWDTEDDTNITDNFIEKPAEVLVLRLESSNRSATQLGVEVPAEIYLDKYMQTHVAASRETRLKMGQGRRRVAKIEEVEKRLMYRQHPTKSTQVDARQLLKHSLGHFTGQNRRDADNADNTNNVSLAADEPPAYAEIAAKLETVMISIDKKLEELAAEKDRIRKAISDMSKAPLPELSDAQPEHRYTLRGVSTKPNVTYLLQQRDPADTTPPIDEDTTPKDFQWWRVEYDTSGPHPRIVASRFDADDVRRAVELEHNSALLVYAHDEALDPEHSEHALSQRLVQFVEKDNGQLQKELTTAVEEIPPPAYDFEIPRTSIESRGRADSLDSTKAMADDDLTGRALPDYMNNALVEQHHGFSLGYDVKSDQNDGDYVHEIHLDANEDLLDGTSTTNLREVEMVEKAHEPLIPKSADAEMGGVESQDMGVGGATHVEDAEMK